MTIQRNIYVIKDKKDKKVHTLRDEMYLLTSLSAEMFLYCCSIVRMLCICFLKLILCSSIFNVPYGCTEKMKGKEGEE